MPPRRGLSGPDWDANNGPSRWINKIVGHGEVDPHDLKLNPRNWKRHPDRQRSALRQTIRDVGFLRSVTVNRQTGYVLDGEARVLDALAVGAELVPVEYVDISPAEEAEALATFDPLSALSVPIDGALDGLLADFTTSDDANDLASMLDELALSYDAPAVESGGSYGMGSPDRPRSVKMVLNCGAVSTVERALAATGLGQRGQALAEVCRVYLESIGAEG